MVETSSSETASSTTSTSTVTRLGKRRFGSLRKLSWETGEAGGGEGGQGDGACVPPALHLWYLVDAEHRKLRLPRTMLFLGREECDIVVPSATVDKRHAVITFDLYLSRFKVKDLSTTNGTYVNDSRIPEQEYVTLNHMDSIRLGCDPGRYYVEQGELCGPESPSPPPLPSHPPPALPAPHPAGYRPHLPDDDGGRMGVGGGGGGEEPAWVSAHGEKLAECQGCIAEQRIEHTCLTAGTSPARSPHPHNPSTHHHPAPPPAPCQRHPPSPPPDETTQDRKLRGRPEPEPEPEPEAAGRGPPGAWPGEEAEADPPRLGRNTWPRKKVRQTLHAAAIFEAEGGGGADAGGGAILVESGSNYFVSVDDSVCDSGGRLAEGYSLSRAGSVQRIPRNSRQPLPPELETVKKGTPLYGQPSWWGEDTETNEERRVEGSRSSRPSSLVVVGSPGDERPFPHHKGVYMEIPHHSDTTPERDKPPLRDKTTPSRSSSSSISKDSLQSALSPDRDGSLGGGGGGGGGGEAPLANPALSFTIDFSDDDRRKSRLQSGASLSQFVPPKIRRSLAEHVRSSASTTTTTNPASASASVSEKVSAPACVPSSGKISAKNSEERELSPTRHKRLDDLWGATPDLGATASATTTTSTPGKPPALLQQGRPSRKSSERATGVPSLRTADWTEASSVAALAADGTSPRSPRTQDARKSSPRSRVTRTRPAGGGAITATVSVTASTGVVLATSVPASAYGSTTEYLLDRMFAGEAARESPPPPPRSDGREDSPVATEHVMYREAREFERAAQRGSGGGGATYRAGDKPPVGVRAKPPSSRKSPAPGPAPRTSSSSASSSSTTPRSPKTLKPAVEVAPTATASKRKSGVAAAAPPAVLPVASASKVNTAAPAAAAAVKPILEKTAATRYLDGELEKPLRAARTPPSTLSRASRGSPPPPPQPSAHVARPALPHLPVAPSPVSDPDPEDKVSEAGTYTIEAEQEDAEEELRARQQIDQVFGVTDLECFAFERPVVGGLGPGAGRRGEPEGKDGEDKEVELEGEEDEVDTTLHDDEVSVEPGNHTPCDDDSSEVFDDEDSEEQAMSSGCGEEEVPSWITQLNALTAAAIHRSPPAAMTDDNQKRSTQGGLSRKRPGTGRKLPSIPLPGSVQSPAGSDNSPSFHDNSPDLAASNGITEAGRVNGHGRSMTESPSRNVTLATALASGKSQLLGAESPSASDLSSRRDSEKGYRNMASARSRGSLDTEVLLRDTETVMAAMEARMFVQKHHTDRRIGDNDGGQGGDSDTDLSSTVAMVNGDDDFVKPTKYHSPRDSLTKTKDRGNSNNLLTNSQLPPTSTSSAVKRSLNRSYSEHKPVLRTPHSAGTGISVLSDVLSRENSLDQSFQSDASDACSDRTDGSSTRQSSRGKGTITNTKPNRAFTLRRARADGSDAVSDSSRSRTSAMSSTTTASTSTTARRSSSMHGTSRTTYTDRTVGRSEASLGAQIAKKAQENTRAPVKARDGSVPRIMDAGARQANRRNSGDFRTVTPNSSLSSSVSLSTSSSKKDRDIRSLKTKLKIAPGGSKELAITGIASRSQSQPGSRSNSPKAAERMAWKRRKEYDPRKAVAEAKEKERRTTRPPKAQSSTFSSKQKMIRSASFTNTMELSSTRKRHDTYSMESNSSVEDLSSAATATDSSCVDFAFRRAFIPVPSTMRGDRLSHSADEDESGTFPVSKETGSVATALGKRPLAILPTLTLTLKSAFTPPLSKLTPSPDSPIPTAASLILRRRTLGGCDFDESGASTAPVSHRAQADSHRNLTNSPQSYDSLIVSSIYQLSLKLKTSSDKMLKKLREQNRVSITPSPIDDFLGHSAKNEIPAWKSANQELAGVLKNLRKMEHHIHLIERVLFPEEEADNDVSGMSSIERHKYYQEIERIRSELAGFQPIDSPRAAAPVSQDPASPEMDELTGEMF